MSICTPIQTLLSVCLPGGRPINHLSIANSNSLAGNNSIPYSGFYPMNISALNSTSIERNVNLILLRVFIIVVSNILDPEYY